MRRHVRQRYANLPTTVQINGSRASAQPTGGREALVLAIAGHPRSGPVLREGNSCPWECPLMKFAPSIGGRLSNRPPAWHLDTHDHPRRPLAGTDAVAWDRFLGAFAGIAPRYSTSQSAVSNESMKSGPIIQWARESEFSHEDSAKP